MPLGSFRSVPDPAPDPEPAEIREQLAESLIIFQDIMGPLFDAAEGVKADMLARGWQPASAEAVAVTWLQTMITTFNGGG